MTATFEQQITDLENRLNDVLNDPDAKHRLGTEIHGKLRRLKKDMDLAVRQGNPPSQWETEMMHYMTGRILTDVFNMDSEFDPPVRPVNPNPEPSVTPTPAAPELDWRNLTDEQKIGLAGLTVVAVAGFLLGRITKR